MKTYICRKCGEEFILDGLLAWGKRACPGCDEPISQDVILLPTKEENCDTPGRHGCGHCPACQSWAEDTTDRLMEREG